MLSRIDQKARLCMVKEQDGAYMVSSPSGHTYRVITHDDGATATCDCVWGQYHPMASTESGCARMRAVWSYLRGA
mgnify:FL=1